MVVAGGCMHTRSYSYAPVKPQAPPPPEPSTLVQSFNSVDENWWCACVAGLLYVRFGHARAYTMKTWSTGHPGHNQNKYTHKLTQQAANNKIIIYMTNDTHVIYIGSSCSSLSFHFFSFFLFVATPTKSDWNTILV